MSEKLTNVQKRAYWQQHVTSFLSSNTTQNEYCRKHSISVCQFAYWRKKISPEAHLPGASRSQSVFSRVKISPKTTESTLAILLCSGITLTGVHGDNAALAIKLAEELS